MLSMCCNSCIKLWKSRKKIRTEYNKIKPFINKYTWKGVNYPSGKDDWKKFEKNYPTVALLVLDVKDVNIYPAYNLKHNSNHEKQIIFVMIPNGEE